MLLVQSANVHHLMQGLPRLYCPGCISVLLVESVVHLLFSLLLSPLLSLMLSLMLSLLLSLMLARSTATLCRERVLFVLVKLILILENPYNRGHNPSP